MGSPSPQNSRARPVSQAGPWASRPWPQSPALPVFFLCPPLPRRPSLLGLQPRLQVSQPAPKLCLTLRCSQLPPGCSLPRNVPRSPRAHHSPYYTSYRCPCCHMHKTPPTAPLPRLSKWHYHPPSTHTRNPGVTSPSCPTRTASAQSPNQAVVSCPMSLMPLLVFPTSALIRTPTPPNGLLLWPPPSQPFSTAAPQLRPSNGFLQPQGSPHSARVPKEPSLSPGTTFSCPHAPSPWTGLLAPTGQFLSSLPLLPFSLACLPPARLVEPLLVV